MASFGKRTGDQERIAVTALGNGIEGAVHIGWMLTGLRLRELSLFAKARPPIFPVAVRVFYDLSGSTVEVLAIVAKSEAESWLTQFANPE